MQFQAALLALIALASAAPSMSLNTKTGVLRARQVPDLCASGSPYCCETDVLGVADLDCVTPTNDPSTTADFESVCSAAGKTTECCLLGADGITLLCTQE